MLIPDWLMPTFLLLPAMLWFFFGVGLGWTLFVLPRRDWRNLVLVVAVNLALSAALTTTTMFLLNILFRYSVAAILGSTLLVSAIGLVLAVRRAITEPRPSRFAGVRPPFSHFEVLLLVLVTAAVLLRFWNTAYWNFTTYDALWVYGYNAKLFVVKGEIPWNIGYYPQNIPLAYTYAQLIWGGINDHAARTVIPYFALMGILLTYVGGARLYNRRVGLIAAAIWALYPHHGVWSQFGDLEVAVTGYFVGTAIFFILGWREKQVRYLVVSGLMLGAGLWTKPTAAALIQSVLMLGALGAGSLLLLRVQRFTRILPKEGERLFYCAVIVLAVGFPMGGMWYLRNVVLNHPIVTLPAGYWQEAAQQSGQELGWFLLLASLAALFTRGARRQIAYIGVGLMWFGSLFSAVGSQLPTLEDVRLMLVGQIATDITPTRLGVIEYGILGIGLLMLWWAIRPCWGNIGHKMRGTVGLLGAFIAPYAVTWFWSYSYHYRLSFPIVPLLALMIAPLTDALIHQTADYFRRYSARFRKFAAYAGLIVVLMLGLLGNYSVLSALAPALTGSLPDDHAKIAHGNAALMGLVDFLAARRAALGRPLKVIAPGELRLNFFFPEDDIQGDSYPLWLKDLVGVDYFVDSSVGQRLYAIQGKLYNQIVASFTRDPVMQRIYTVDDGNFRFSVYTINHAARFATPSPNGQLNVTVGDFAFLYGHDLSRLDNYPGQRISLTFWWKALKPAQEDYSVFIHLWDPKANKLIAAWGGQPVSGAWSVWYGKEGATFSQAYPTRLWQTDEIIKDEWSLQIPLSAPSGSYELRVGMFEPISGERLEIRKDGKLIGDSVFLNQFSVLGEAR